MKQIEVPVKEHFKNGKVKVTGMYRYDKRHGDWVWYRATGQVSSTCTYHLGKSTGQAIWYHKDGRVMSIQFYNDKGKRITEKEWLIHCNLELILQ